MNMQRQDGWRRPENIYRSLLTSAALTMGVVMVACAVTVLVCHAFETPAPEANLLRYAYAHGGMIVAVVSMVFGFTAIHVTLKLNESVKILEFHQRYSGEDALRAIRAVADVGRMWERDAVGEFGHPRFVPRSNNDDYNWHEFHGLMKVLKDVYPTFSTRTRSHLARPVYWDGATGKWQEQAAARKTDEIE